MWDKLVGIQSWWNLTWCIGGDFNVTCFPSERSRGGGCRSAMLEFLNFIPDLGLMDLELAGGLYT